MTEDIGELLKTHRAPLGRRPDSPERRAEAGRLASLLDGDHGFSFGRIGDFDVALLLSPEQGEKFFRQITNKVSGTEPSGSPGLAASQTGRLRTALEKISYLDFHERLWKDNTLLDDLALKRPVGSHRNPNWETSYILPEWLIREFRKYCSGRRVLFCGAEAPLLEALSRKEIFRRVATDYWPDDANAIFLRPREDGRNLGANLDLIKADIVDAVGKHGVEVVFISLGGAAKILCQELADELGIRTIDFGASLRSLTYSGSDGCGGMRSPHFIYLYRVPFDVHMDALEEAWPDMPPELLLAKAHAQLLLEIQEKEPGWSHSAWEYDFGPENLQHFHSAHEQYGQRYRRVFRASEAARRERAAFLHFCGKHKLTWAGRKYFMFFQAKSAIARMRRPAAEEVPA